MFEFIGIIVVLGWLLSIMSIMFWVPWCAVASLRKTKTKTMNSTQPQPTTFCNRCGRLSNNVICCDKK